MIEGLPKKSAPEINVLKVGMQKTVSTLFSEFISYFLANNYKMLQSGLVLIEMQFYCCRISSKSTFQSLRFRCNIEKDNIMVSVARTFD